MTDFNYKSVDDIGILQRGDHVAWKHASQSGRVYYHHAIVEEVNKTDGYINVIAKTVKGVGRSVIDNLDGIHLVDVISKPQCQEKPGGVLGFFSGLIPSFGNDNQQKKIPEGKGSSVDATVESPEQGASCDPEDQARELREAVYKQARSMITDKKYQAQMDNCETFAYKCRTGQDPEKHDCPMCTTSAQKDKFIFH